MTATALMRDGRETEPIVRLAPARSLGGSVALMLENGTTYVAWQGSQAATQEVADDAVAAVAQRAFEEEWAPIMPDRIAGY